MRGRVRYSAHAATLAVTCDSVRLVTGSARVIAPTRGRYRGRLDVGGMTAWALLRSTALAASRDLGTPARVPARRRTRRLASLPAGAPARDRGRRRARRRRRLAAHEHVAVPRRRTSARRSRRGSRPTGPTARVLGRLPPAGARTGWPLEPFHRAHPLRSGLNEWRPANMHIGLDIQALDGTRVYAVQSGRARIAGAGRSTSASMSAATSTGTSSARARRPARPRAPDGHRAGRPRAPAICTSRSCAAATSTRCAPVAACWRPIATRGAGDRRRTAQAQASSSRRSTRSRCEGPPLPHARAGAGRDRVACTRRRGPRDRPAALRLSRRPITTQQPRAPVYGPGTHRP